MARPWAALIGLPTVLAPYRSPQPRCLQGAVRRPVTTSVSGGLESRSALFAQPWKLTYLLRRSVDPG